MTTTATRTRKVVVCREWKLLLLSCLFSISIFVNLLFFSNNVFEGQLNNRVQFSPEEEKKEYAIVVNSLLRTNHSSGEQQFIKQTNSFLLRTNNTPSSLWEVFKTNNTKCFFIEDFCHSSYRWFYHPNGRSSGHPEQQQQQGSSRKRQPRFELETNIKNAWKPYSKAGYPEKIITDHLQEADVSFEKLNCRYSSIPNHVVQFNVFNHMLGEFYDRGLTALYNQFAYSFHFSKLFESSTTSNGTDAEESLDQFEEFLEHTQLYLHLEHPTRKLLDSHHLFSSLFRRHPLLDLTALLHDAKCQCFNRVAFCGYEARIQQNPKEKQPNSIDTTNTTTTRQNNTTVLAPKQDLDVGESFPETYSGLRNLFRRRLNDENQFAQNDIQRYRTEVFRKHRVHSSKNNGWRIVGLTQRTGRRRWLNLDSVLHAASGSLRDDKIIMVKVNVEEEEWNPYIQLIRHSALDGLVGIHGAQMTEAIWMPPGSLVVELLPYTPKERPSGHWTRQAHMPTPLGRIFTNTDLNHIGVPLDIESAPYCVFRNVTGCWLVEETRSDRWDDRDFQVDSRKIEYAVRSMMNLTSSGVRAESCNDYLQVAKKEYVLYNINCKKNEEQKVAPKHFYWKK